MCECNAQPFLNTVYVDILHVSLSDHVVIPARTISESNEGFWHAFVAVLTRSVSTELQHVLGTIHF